MDHDTFFVNDTGIKIKRLLNKQLVHFVKNQGNCPCITKEDSFWPHVKYDPLCHDIDSLIIGYIHRGVKLATCMHTLYLLNKLNTVKPEIFATFLFSLILRVRKIRENKKSGKYLEFNIENLQMILGQTVVVIWAIIREANVLEPG